MDKEEFLEPCRKAYGIHRASPYGDMWRKMSYHELASIAAYKARRATLLPPEDPKVEDDILDAINFLIFAWHQGVNKKEVQVKVYMEKDNQITHFENVEHTYKAKIAEQTELIKSLKWRLEEVGAIKQEYYNSGFGQGKFEELQRLEAKIEEAKKQVRWEVGEELCCLVGNLMLEDMEAGKKLGEQLNEYMKNYLKSPDKRNER